MGYYIIDSIELKDFLSHGNTKLTFPSGSLAFLGENGAGKSSILEALYFTLTLKPWRDRSFLIKANSNKAEIKVKLKELGGNDILELRVDITKKGKDSLATEVMLKKNNKVEATRQEDYKRLIKQYLNMQSIPEISDFIQNSIIVKQNTLSNIANKMTDSKKDFKELIESALGIESYKDAEENLKSIDVKSDSQNIGLIYNIKPRHLEEINKNLLNKQKEIEAILKELEINNNNISIKEREKEDLEKLIEDQKKKLEESQSKLLNLNRLIAKKEELTRFLEKKIKEIDNKKHEIENLMEEIRNIEALKNLANLYDKLNEYDSLINEYKEIEIKRKDLELIKTNYEQLMIYKQYEDEYNKNNERKEVITEDLNRLNIEINKYLSLNNDYKNKMKRIKDLINNSNISNEMLSINLENDLDIVISKIENEVKQLDTIMQGLSDEIKSLESELSKKELEINKMKEYLKVLSTEKEDSIECPVCHTKLSGKTIEDLKENYINEINIHEKEFKELKKIIEEKNKDQKEYNDKEKKLSKILEEIKILKDQITDEMKISDKRLNELKVKKKSLEEELKNINNLLEDLEESHRQYLAAKVYLDNNKIQLNKIPELLNEFNEVNKKYNDMKARIEAILNIIYNEAKIKDINKARIKINDARTKYSSLEKYKSDLKKYEEELLSMQKDYNDGNEELNKINNEINFLKDIENVVNNLKIEIDKNERLYQDTLKEISKLEGEKKNYEDNLNKLKQEISSLEELKNKIIVGLASINIFDKVQRSLYNNALIALENEMNDVFMKFGLDYSKIEIRESSEGNLGVYIIDRSGNERPISVLSGGEQSVIALAFIIALNKIIQAKIGFLALDEPTESLDEQRRRTLIDILGKLTESNNNLPPPINQLIVISHHSDIMESIEQVCSVVKENGESKVKCEGESNGF